MARPRKGQDLNAYAKIGLRLSRALQAKLEAIAHRHDRSITDEVRFALTRYVENDELQPLTSRNPN
jgi:hypothetical protein